MKMSLLLLTIVLNSGVALAIEEPEYKIIEKTARYEVRNYGDILVAETKVDATFKDAGSQAFKVLYNYINGDNRSNTKIEMTVPVLQEETEGGYLVQFTMPKEYTLSGLPIPNDSRVTLRRIPARKVAVYSYSGTWSWKNYHENLTNFQYDLKKKSIMTPGKPILARYNSPLKPWFLRRNEIWLEINN